MKVEIETYRGLLNRFIALANQMKDEGQNINVVANALMEATAIYSTFVVAGNQGHLNDSGISKMTEVFQAFLTKTQQDKQAQAGSEPEPSGKANGQADEESTESPAAANDREG